MNRAALFPLLTVLFPGGVIPLVAFEERYRQLAREQSEFVVVLIRRGGEVGADRISGVHEIGTLATVDHKAPLADGSISIVARGLRRVRVLSLARDRPYLMGVVEPVPDPAVVASARLVDLLRRGLEQHGEPSPAPELAEPWAGVVPGARAVWIAGTLLHQIDPQRRQRLLESCDPVLAEALLAQQFGPSGRA
jgi:Lon protease-like protein